MDRLAARFSGTDRTVAEYLDDEVLAGPAAGRAAAAAADERARVRERIRAVRSARQPIPTASLVRVAFDDAEWQSDCAIEGTRLLVRTAGLYVITATLEWEADPIGWRTAFLRVSDDGNAAYDQRPPVKGAETIQAITALQAMAAGAYVELIVRQNSGSTLELGGGAHVQTSVSAAWLAP